MSGENKTIRAIGGKEITLPENQQLGILKTRNQTHLIKTAVILPKKSLERIINEVRRRGVRNGEKLVNYLSKIQLENPDRLGTKGPFVVAYVFADCENGYAGKAKFLELENYSMETQIDPEIAEAIESSEIYKHPEVSDNLDPRDRPINLDDF